DIGEFWASPAIGPGGTFTDAKSNLFVYSGGPDATIKFGAVGTADNPRTIQVSVNGNVAADTVMNSFNDLVTTRPVPLAQIAGGTATVGFQNSSTVSTDRMVVSFYEINYPRQFNFGGAANFTFQLPARPAGYLLNITNVAASASTPVLYDMTNGYRYTAVVNGSTLAFALNGSTATMNLVLVNEDPSTVQSVNSLTSKTFLNLANSANQGNYIIISNPLLSTSSSGSNPLVDYKNYRSSATGGGFDAQVYDINELVDQFAFGIKKDPLSIQNFMRYARAKFATKPQYVLLIGHSMVYSDYYTYDQVNRDPLADVLNLVPTFGNPASDNKLSADDGVGATPITPIGRLSVVSGDELETYLTKVKEYEQVQTTAPNTIAGRLWMKNGVHLTGVSEPYLGTIICNYMTYYGSIISDTLTGASISLFCDGNASQVSQVPVSVISNLFATGLSFLDYFGHSSNTVLGYNLDNPNDYNNQGKYPIFFINGCDAGNFFIYDDHRPGGTSKTLSETYVLAPERGSIAFVASTNFGIVNYLNILLTGLYNLMDGSDYGKPLGILQKDALNGLVNAVPGDFFARLHAEQMTTHGDPYIKLNQGPTDYDIESSQVTINPTLVSVSNTVFTVSARIYNLGKAVSDSVQVTVTRTFPNGTSALLLSKKLKGIRYVDSIQLAVPIVASRDKGVNKITITVNPANVIPEVTYANNSVTTDVFIYQDGATPVYPYNYAIINTPTSKLIASTANPLIPSTQYVMELDTTQNFNSSLKVDKYLTSVGGELEFDPGVNFMDSVVYYWRVSPVPTTPTGVYTWNYSSFIYIDPARSSTGMNQSHYFQHQGSTADSMQIAASRQWTFGTTTHNFYITNAMYPTSGIYEQDFALGVDGNSYIQSACIGHSLIFNVFNPITLRAWLNVDPSTGNNLYLSGSAAANCGPQRWWNFEFSYESAASRYLMTRFMDSIPAGYFVVVRSFDYDASGGSYCPNWRADTSLYGSGKSLYHYLLNAGFADVDSITFPRDWQFIYKKGDPSFVPQYKISQGLFDKITQSLDASAPLYSGTVISPLFGPSKKWSQVHWRGHDPVTPVTDTVGVQIVGIDTLGNFSPLYNLSRGVQDFDVSAVNARQYPYLQLRMTTLDTVHAKPFQLDYWRVNYTPVPEGAIAPNILLKAPDTVALGQPIEFAIAFKNVSPFNFDSMRVKLYLQDRSGAFHTITLPRKKPLVTGDTVAIDYTFDSKPYSGANTIYVGFNPDNDQPEQYLGNNFVYKPVFVKGDSRNPNLDVTFDNVHILNEDIVSAKPHIQIKLQSQSQYLLLTDTSLVNVQVKYPDGSLHTYRFNTDTLRFTP
ncbi:MAG TPA: C25 family cysteine peptidase, partial [Puia sp.]|nr:C25 family cysteine peptidase [Puia sp.]